jgi:hypothetical protein
MRYLVMLAVLALAATGCATKSSSLAVRLPNGNIGAIVKCKHKAECFNLATIICASPYQVLEANDEATNDFHSSYERVEYVVECWTDPKVSE